MLESPDSMVSIDQVAKALAPYRVVFTPKALYLLSKGEPSVVGEMIGMQFGLLGMLISYIVRRIKLNKLKNDPRRQNMAMLSPDEIVAQDPKSVKLVYEEILNYKTQNFLMHYRGLRPIIIRTMQRVHRVYLPKVVYDQALTLLGQYCPGKKV